MAQLNSASRMSFFEHFDELRVRTFRCLFVFFAGFIAFYFLSEPMMAFLRKPLFEVMPPDQQKLYFVSLFENFLTHLKIAGYASVFFLSPYYFYQIWGFIQPGLYPREKKLVVPFVGVATVFFLGGASFAYYGLFPVGFKYFVSYGGPTDVPLLTIDSYYSTCLKLLLLFGIAFELPVIVCLLGYLGLVDSTLLKAQRRNAILGITVLSAIFAPPDAVSMLILGVPLVILYEGAIWVVYLIEKNRSPAVSARSSAASAEPKPHPLEGRSRP